jgi:hypothetical protein
MDLTPDDKSIQLAVHYLDKVVDAPLAELSGILADRVNFWRFKNKVRIILKAKKFLEEKGIDPQRALPGTVIPLIEAAGDADDDRLSDMFAALLATHVSPSGDTRVHPSYAKVLAQLSPLDARVLSEVLEDVCQPGRDYHKRVFPADRLAGVLGVPLASVVLSLQNIRRLGLGWRGSSPDELNQTEQLGLTDYGWSFLGACIPAQAEQPPDQDTTARSK